MSILALCKFTPLGFETDIVTVKLTLYIRV